jgi:hypothetical protein
VGTGWGVRVVWSLFRAGCGGDGGRDGWGRGRSDTAAYTSGVQVVRMGRQGRLADLSTIAPDRTDTAVARNATGFKGGFHRPIILPGVGLPFQLPGQFTPGEV